MTRIISKHIKYRDSFIEGEVWKAVVGYEGLYEVSDLGRIKSLPKRKGRFLHNESHILSQKNHRDGYKVATLCKDKKLKSYQTHRLVAQAFLSNPENKREVNHIDFNKSNNILSNLEWSSSQENKIHSLNHNRLPSAKITWQTVREIRELRKQGVTIPALVSMFPIKRTAIGNIVYNKTWIENDRYAV